MNISRASAYGREPNPSTITRTSTPSASFRSSSAAIRIPTSPSRQPNMRMCTDERAASTSAKMRGKKFAPSTQRLDRRRRRPGEVERRVVRARAVARRERLRRGLRARRRHRVGRRRPARPLRDPEHLPVDDDEERRRHQRADRERLAPAPAWPRASVAGSLPEEATRRVLAPSRPASSPGSRSPPRRSASSSTWTSDGPVRSTARRGRTTAGSS